MARSYEQALKDYERIEAKYGTSLRRGGTEVSVEPPVVDEARAASPGGEREVDRSVNFSLPTSGGSPTRLHIHRNGEVDIFTASQVDVDRYVGVAGPGPSAPVAAAAPPPTEAALRELRDINRTMRSLRSTPPREAARGSPPGARGASTSFPSPGTARYGTTAALGAGAGDGGSSRAVLSALRALQDKIKRLEGERARALDDCSSLRQRLEESEASARRTRDLEQLSASERVSASKLACERLQAEKNVLELRATRAEEQKKSLLKEVEAVRSAAAEAEIGRRTAEASLAVAEDRTRALDRELGDMRTRTSVVDDELSRERDAGNKREVELGMLIQDLEAQLRQERDQRVAAEAEKHRLDDFLKGLIGVNEALVRNLEVNDAKNPKAARGRRTKRRKDPLDTGLRRRSRSAKRRPAQAAVGSMPFLPAGQRVSFNVLAALSEAVSQAYRANPQEALETLYRRLGLPLGSDDAARGPSTSGVSHVSHVTHMSHDASSRRHEAPAEAQRPPRMSPRRAREVTIPRPRGLESAGAGRSRLRRRSESRQLEASATPRRATPADVSRGAASAGRTSVAVRAGDFGLSPGYSIASAVASADNLVPPPVAAAPADFSMKSSASSWRDLLAGGSQGSTAAVPEGRGSGNDFDNVEQMLQEEYDQLDTKYHRLLDSMKRSDGGGVDGKCAEELADVIHELQRKQRELRLLRKGMSVSHPASPPRPRPTLSSWKRSPLRSPDAADRMRTARAVLQGMEDYKEGRHGPSVHPAFSPPKGATSGR